MVRSYAFSATRRARDGEAVDRGEIPVDAEARRVAAARA